MQISDIVESSDPHARIKAIDKQISLLKTHMQYADTAQARGPEEREIANLAAERRKLTDKHGDGHIRGKIQRTELKVPRREDGNTDEVSRSVKKIFSTSKASHQVLNGVKLDIGMTFPSMKDPNRLKYQIATITYQPIDETPEVKKAVKAVIADVKRKCC